MNSDAREKPFQIRRPPRAERPIAKTIAPGRHFAAMWGWLTGARFRAAGFSQVSALLALTTVMPPFSANVPLSLLQESHSGAICSPVTLVLIRCLPTVGLLEQPRSEHPVGHGRFEKIFRAAPMSHKHTLLRLYRLYLTSPSLEKSYCLLVTNTSVRESRPQLQDDLANLE